MRPRFVLAREGSGRERHALAPGLADGPSLCGLIPAYGWILWGATCRLDQIDCSACRDRAAALAAAASVVPTAQE